MDIKKFLLAVLAVFVFIFIYDWVVHGHLLMGIYEETRPVWRHFDEMQSFMPIAIGFKLALAAWITYVFTQLFPKGGLTDGLRFGLYFGVFAGIAMSASYIWLPIPDKLAVSWFVTSLVQGLGFGAILGSIYK